MKTIDPTVYEFIRFCVQRNGKEWPALYDEMCRVAGQRLFRGLGYGELREMGLSLSLNNIDDTVKMVDDITT